MDPIRFVVRGQQSGRWARLGAVMLALLTVLALAGCGRAVPAPATPPPPTPQTFPDKQNSVVVRPEDGATIGLGDGAQLVLPPDSVSETTVVTLRVVDSPPHAPVPRNVVGRAYEFALDGGQLTGVGLLTLPLPADANAEQYDLAPYRWNGRNWERLAGRVDNGSIRSGSDKTAVIAILGQWRMADASLSLAVPAPDAARQDIPFEVTGQYRYDAPPLQQHDYTEAQLVLKRDSTGGAARISGDDALDQTVAETVMWFKPDTGQPSGLVDFSYTFRVAPATLDVALGSVVRLYAVLTVIDSAAPTRRFSTGAEYNQIVPIQLNGTEVVRPALNPETEKGLQWNVRLNGESLFVRPATELSLSLAEALAQGGLGEYKITLEAEADGKYRPVSNEVTVQLALPVTITPAAVAVVTGQPGAIRGTPGITATVSPFGTMPPTPTRRTPPKNLTPVVNAASTPTLTVAATASVTATMTPVPTRPQWASVFWADTYQLPPDGCTDLHWNVEGIQSILLDNNPTVGTGNQRVCLKKTTTFTLHMTDVSGTTQDQRVTITVTNPNATTEPNTVVFSADEYQITKSQCTNLRWRGLGVREVFLDDSPVVGEPADPHQVCPETTTTYRLKVVTDSGTEVYQLRILVAPADTISILFWAEQYTLKSGNCTTIHWSVEHVQEVYLTLDGAEEGVGGEGFREHICPPGTKDYTLRVIADDDHQASKKITLQIRDDPPGAGQVIAQGIVNDVSWMDDVDTGLPGEQPGWQVLVDGVSPLYSPSGGCCETTVKLRLPQGPTIDPYSTSLDWPIKSGQLIEFRASCNNSICTVNLVSPYYMKLISP